MTRQNTLNKKLTYGTVSLLILSYAFWIVYSNYQSQLELRNLSLQRVETEFQHRTKTLARFLDERKEDVRSLAADRSVMTYFENKALGMTMMYGLAISINNVGKRFSTLQESKRINERSIFPRVILLDREKNILVDMASPEFQAADGIASVSQRIGGSELVSRHDDDNPGYLVISSPCLYKEKVVGWIGAWVPYSIFFDEFLKTSSSDMHEDFLLFATRDRSVAIREPSVTKNTQNTKNNKEHIDSGAVASLLNRGGRQIVFDSTDHGSHLVFAHHPETLPFEVVKLVARDQILGRHNPRTLFIGMGTVFCLLFLGMIMLIQLSLKQQINAVKLDEAKERHRRISAKNEELELARREIERQNEELKELDRLKDDFLANTSHELKTPLNGIDGLVLSLLDGKYGTIPSELGEPLEMVHDSSLRLMKMVDQILTFSRLSAGKSESSEKKVERLNVADVLA
ncbi:MAG: HAMP domain-containing sensor histidine kinase, partial [Thermodesulfobacteriota bacterium]